MVPNVWNSFLDHYSIATDEQKHQTRVSGHLVTGSFGHRVIWSPGHLVTGLVVSGDQKTAGQLVTGDQMTRSFGHR